MKKLNNELYTIVRNSLQGNTIEEKLADLENRIFMNDMIDTWSKEDYEFDEVLHQLKDELEEMKNGQ